MTPAQMHTQFDYHRWATTRMLDACGELSEKTLQQPVGGAFGSLFAVLVHLYSADDIWLARWQGGDRGFTAPDAFSGLTPLHTVWILKQAELATFLDATDPEEVFEVRGYRHPLWQMVAHLVDHGSFHRGQVMHWVRRADVAPPPSNFIHYLRTRQDKG
ncbi:hypothetical protein BH24DEI2_BH24DEI2_00340 [soil metagenome]